MTIQNRNSDWSEHTVRLRPLLAQLEEALNGKDIAQAEALAREIKERAEGVIGYCMRKGR